MSGELHRRHLGNTSRHHVAASTSSQIMKQPTNSGETASGGPTFTKLGHWLAISVENQHRYRHDPIPLELLTEVGDKSLHKHGIRVFPHSLLSAAFFVLNFLPVRTVCQVALPVALRAIFGPLRLYPVFIQENAILETFQIPHYSGEKNRVAPGWKTRLCPGFATLPVSVSTTWFQLLDFGRRPRRVCPKVDSPILAEFVAVFESAMLHRPSG